MKKPWIVLLVLLTIATGCEQPSAQNVSNHGPIEPGINVETPQALNARQVLDNALAAAKADDKALFVDFSADW